MHQAQTDHYNLYLVMLAFLIIWLASYTSLNLSNRISISKARQHKLWIACSAITIGTGAWTMHFIAMLASYSPALLINNTQSVLASLAVAVIGSLIGFFITHLTGPGILRLLLGGTFMGLSVSSMHYMGIGAMNLVEIRYSPILFIFSILIAIGTSITVLKLSAAPSPRLLFRGFLISFAFMGMHYLESLSAVLTLPASPLETGEPASQMNAFVIAMLVAFATIIFLSASLMYSLRMAQKLAEQSELKASLLDISIDSILMFNSRGWIIECNPAAMATFGYTRKQALSLTMLDFLYPLDQNGEAAAALFQRLARQDAALLGKRVQMKAYRSDRSEFPAEITITKIPIAGKMMYAATIRDLTENNHGLAAIS